MLNDENNKKNLEKIVENLKGKINPTEEQLKKLKELSEQYSNKPEEELIAEIIKLNKVFSQNMDKKEYEEKLKKLERIKPLLNDEQKKKLDKILEIIKRTE